VDRRHAVRAVRSHDRQVGHADLALFALLDEAHALDAPLVAGKAKAHFVEEPPVDLIDDLEMPGKKDLEPRRRPFLPAPQAATCDWCKRGSFS